jgi:hypothetical protein
MVTEITQDIVVFQKNVIDDRPDNGGSSHL